MRAIAAIAATPLSLARPHAPCARYIPVLMAQAKIYWDMEHYEMVRRADPLAGPDASPMRPRRAERPSSTAGCADALCLCAWARAPQVERIFKQSFEFCSAHDVWKLNVAHVFFMQVRCAGRPARPPAALIGRCHRSQSTSTPFGTTSRSSRRRRTMCEQHAYRASGRDHVCV